MNTTAQLSARERINSLLDDNSFVEVGALVTRRSTDFNLQQNEIPADGRISGLHGRAMAQTKLSTLKDVTVACQDEKRAHGLM